MMDGSIDRSIVVDVVVDEILDGRMKRINDPKTQKCGEMQSLSVGLFSENTPNHAKNDKDPCSLIVRWGCHIDEK
jgi:hypothetical protein